jgi:hypothetical protein
MKKLTVVSVEGDGWEDYLHRKKPSTKKSKESLRKPSENANAQISVRPGVAAKIRRSSASPSPNIETKSRRPQEQQMRVAIYARVSTANNGQHPVMGAMLGDLGYSFPVSTATGKGDLSRMEQVTLKGGKMLRHHGDTPIAPENTTISAIIVVERYGIGEKRFRLFVHEREQELGRELGVEEYLELAEQSAGTERDLSLNRIRVRVHENPYAKVPLDRRLFRGPFDERYGETEDTGRCGRIYVGRGVAEFEEKSAAAKLLSRS